MTSYGNNISERWWKIIASRGVNKIEPDRRSRSKYCFTPKLAVMTSKVRKGIDGTVSQRVNIK